MKNKLYYDFAASCFLLVFVGLGYFIKVLPHILTYIDKPITYLIRTPLTSSHTRFFLWITKFGNPLTLAILVATISIIFWQRKLFPEIVWLISNVVICGLGLQFLSKFFFQRPRPILEHLVEASGTSFPSGHSMNAVLCYGTILLLLPIFVKGKYSLLICQFALVILILLIGVSRVYLGVHFPTDVIGGFALALSWLLAAYPHYQKQRVIWLLKKNFT